MRLTSILKKAAMALTGLALFGFVVTHLIGNLHLFESPEAVDDYTRKLHAYGWLLIAAELGLALTFLLHAYTGIRVTLENRKARVAPYQVKRTAGAASFASRSMVVGGVLLFVFVVIHVRTFKFGAWDFEHGGLGRLVIHTFHNNLTVAWYELAMIALGMHLSHGFSSAFQTLGAVQPRWRPPLKQAGRVLGWALALGFMALPIYAATQPDPVAPVATR